MSEAVLDQSARITRIPAPIASPGCCRICGKNEHPKGFAATDNFDEEFYGTVYFCYDCVGDYARIFGYMSEEQVENLKLRVDRQDEELAVLRESVVNLENILDAYAKLRHNANPVVSSDDDSVSEPTSVDEGASEAPTEPVSDGESGEGATAEPSSVEGRDDVRDATSADDLFAELGL